MRQVDRDRHQPHRPGCRALPARRGDARAGAALRPAEYPAGRTCSARRRILKLTVWPYPAERCRERRQDMSHGNRKVGLSAVGLTRTAAEHWNLGTAALYEEALRRKEGE